MYMYRSNIGSSAADYESIIIFNDNPAADDSPTVKMNITDMLASHLILNETHLIYGFRGESLKVSGQSFKVVFCF